MSRLAFSLALAAVCGCPGAPRPQGIRAGQPLASVSALAADYKQFLDAGRTPSHAIEYALSFGSWRVVDVGTPPTALAPGERLAFVNRGRTVIFVIVGESPMAEGFRMVASHIDTPAPRLLLGGLSKRSQETIKTRRYGGTRTYHWPNRGLAIVGMVGTASGEQRVELGLSDDFAFWGEFDAAGEFVITTGSSGGESAALASFVGEMNKRYGVTASDLETAELYAVPAARARDVGLDRAFVGAHGQDDRSNSYVAWRAILDLDRVPKRTAMTWLVDREEEGSAGPTGAESRFLELVVAYLLRAQNEQVTEAVLHRTYAGAEILSSDTPACVNPNFPEAHEMLNAPKAGLGPAVFPYTGRNGKQGGGAASAQFIAALRASFDRAKAPLQHGLLGHVERGGGGTIAKDLAHRGAQVVDVGVCVISMHSPLELVARADLWSLYRGLRSWFVEDIAP